MNSVVILNFRLFLGIRQQQKIEIKYWKYVDCTKIFIQ